MNTPSTFDQQAPLQEQIIFVLSKLVKATVDEITMEIMELKGIASEEGVANLTLEVSNELKNMRQAGTIKEVTEADKQKRFLLR